MSDQAPTQIPVQADNISPTESRLLYYLYGLAAGISLTILVITVYNNGYGITPSFPDAARIRTLDFYETTTHPSNIELKIEPPDQIKKEAGENSIAYALISHNPCLIVIPSNMPIIAWPQERWAAFKNGSDSDTIAHELLHCLVGGWHPR